MKKLTSFFALLSICAYAYGFKMDGIYYNITGDNTVEVTGSEIYTGEINIPNSIYFDSTEYIITSIKSFAFSGYSGLTSINIPASVTNIGNSAFSCCSGLTSINIPAGVTNIGEYTFSACYGLTSINIPANVTTIENCAFSDCRGLESINIPASVTNIGEYAFISCSGLTSIVVESGNNVYDSRNNCNAIIKTSDNSLIRGCKNTIIPTSVTNIGNSAFDCCSDLTSINISASVTNIGNNAFEACSGLTSIDIPASVTNIGEYAFYGCSGLISIVVESGNSVYDSRNNCNAIIKTNDNNLLLGCKNTVIPTGVTSIENLAFALCYDLTSINIPASVTNIGEYAFRDCI